MNELINDEAVCRRALATPGLLTRQGCTNPVLTLRIPVSFLWF